MSEAPNDWPVAEFDPVQRLRVVAAGLPHVAYGEAVLDAPVEAVWAVMGDLEHGTPRYELAVRSARIVRRRGDRHLDLDVHTSLGTRMSFEVEIWFGWCVMQSGGSQIGLAATPVDGGRRTRVAHFEGSRLLGRLVRRYFEWNIRGDFRRIERLAREHVDAGGEGN